MFSIVFAMTASCSSCDDVIFFSLDARVVIKPSRIPIPIFYTHPELWRSWSETCLYGSSNASGASSSSDVISAECDVDGDGASAASSDDKGRRRSIVAS